jgi:hypothetical protein
MENKDKSQCGQAQQNQFPLPGKVKKETFNSDSGGGGGGGGMFAKFY